MNIFYHTDRDDWIIDRIFKEFKEYSKHNVINSFSYNENTIRDIMDVIWLNASHSWKMLIKNPVHFQSVYTTFPVLCTIHHIVPWKWNKQKYDEFMLRDQFVNLYHTYTEETARIIKEISKKPVVVIPHWVDTKTWFSLDKNECRKELGIRKSKFVIGSFQRDTEGDDLSSPKLEKGPDIFLEIVKQFNLSRWNVLVLLGGYRRQYITNQLTKAGINYKYFEKADITTVNKMYNSCDLYIVSSRCEGGPQALFEASSTKTPIISSNVGQATNLLDKRCIYSLADNSINPKMKFDVPHLETVEVNYKKILNYKSEKHVQVYDDLLENLVNDFKKGEK